MMQLFTGYSVPIQKSVTAQAPGVTTVTHHQTPSVSSGSHFSRRSSGVPIPLLHPLEVSVPSERYPPPHHSFSTRSPPSPACDYYNTLVSEQTDSHGRRAQWRSVFRAAMRRRRPPAKRCNMQYENIMHTCMQCAARQRALTLGQRRPRLHRHGMRPVPPEAHFF